MNKLRLLTIYSVMTLLLLTAGCASFKQAYDLSQVKFKLDHISAVRVAGIDLMHIDSPDQLNVYQMARATLAVSRNNLPLDLTLHLTSENPLANRIATTLSRMDWTLILDGRETISGTLEEDISLPAGQVLDIPLHLKLNMLEFFDAENAMELLDMALAFAGENGRIPQGVALKIRPVINTPFGPMHYGKPLLIKPDIPKKAQTYSF
ncbi:LEA type 2 family protein [Mariprofundus ferrooxydans]|nr:LEA type 2 family protein [Mariprofundus ferrooxydans]